MNKKQTELLFKDLCGRLPYKVYAQIPDEYGGYTSAIESIDIDGFVKDFEGTQIEIENIKPYLFPLSSMTKEQKNQLKEIWDTNMNKALDYTISGEEGLSDLYQLFAAEKVIDWLNKNHFDYRYLIPLGLANDATGLGIYENR